MLTRVDVLLDDLLDEAVVAGGRGRGSHGGSGAEAEMVAAACTGPLVY